MCGSECRSPTPAQAHCAECHATFGGASGFDLHRRNGECLAPQSVDLVERDGIWRYPATERSVEHFRELQEAK